MDVLLNRLEERANFKKDRQALQDSMNTSSNSSVVVHKLAPIQQKDLSTYAGKYTGHNSKQPSLQELIEEQDEIINNLCKKLVANDKILEDINVKMDIFSEILKDQAIFNAELESKLSKLSAVAPVATNPEQVFNVQTRGGKQTTDPPYPKGIGRPPARTPTVEEVVQEEQDSARQDFHDTNFIPYPRTVRKPQVDDQFRKFIEVIQKLYVNIPLFDAMQVPTYAKYI
jgi:predicted transcriptional regulator